MGPEIKKCQNCGKEFTIEPQDFDFYEKILPSQIFAKGKNLGGQGVPAPTWCPECRLKRRLIFRNEHVLYKRKDSRTGEMIFSTIPESAPVKVYDRDYWWSDNWDSMQYGRDYDFQRPFFEQFIELSREVPWFSRSVLNLVNSDYCANANDLKNCYLLFCSNHNEDCFYGVEVTYSKDSFDNYYLQSGELCYQCFMVQKSYRVFFSSHCQNCQDVYFSQNLANCQNCFACCNLRNKQYHIFNKPYSREGYFEELNEFGIGSYKNIQGIQKRAEDFWLKFPNKYIQGIKNINVSGNYINFSKNVLNSFFIDKGEECKYCSHNSVGPIKDSYDYSLFGQNVQLVYESTQVGIGSSNINFCCICYPNCQDLQYCLMCSSSSNLFGCIGLRHKEYCILNKQYTKEEYEQLVPKIIEHMNKMPYKDKKGRIYKYGEFFPPELSPFAYNETIAQEYFPLTKDQALEQGYKWKDPEPRDYKIDIKTEDLPDNIKDVPDDIVGKVIECASVRHSEPSNSEAKNPEERARTTGSFGEQSSPQDDNKGARPQHDRLRKPQSINCTTAFKITPQELDFYRKMGLPLPRYCPNCRHYQRLKQRNPLKLWQRQCQCGGEQSTDGVYQNTTEHFHGTERCPNTFQTTYSPDRPEIVYCKECYQREVV